MDPRELLRQAVPPPRSDLDVSAVAGAANRRRRRRRAYVLTALATAVVASCGGVLALAGGDDSPRIEVGSETPTAVNEGAGVSVELPPGWRDLPRVEGTAPTEVLVVGTADRPQADPITACGGDGVPQTRSAYVSLYEYLPGDPLTTPGGEGTYGSPIFGPRPADFAIVDTPMAGDCQGRSPNTSAPVVNPSPSLDTTPTTVVPGGPPQTDPTTTTEPSTTIPDTTLPPTSPTSSTPDPSAPSTTTPALDNHFREFAFMDGNRTFVARAVSIDDPSEVLLAEAFRVLNSLVVQPGSVVVIEPTLPTTTLPPAGEPPADKPGAERQIHDAFTAAFGSPSPISIEDAVEGGFPLSLPDRATASTTPGAEVAGHIVVQINWIVFNSPTRATVNFDLLVDGQTITINTTGYAVYEGSNWRLGRATWCEVTQRGGAVLCPS
jgi:hypothetical protein